jgi:hypothetical protein
MGAMYSVHPLIEKIKLWLDEQSIEYPADINGRNPTLSEIQQSLGQLVGYSSNMTVAEIGKPWQAFIEDRMDPEKKGWAILNIINLTNSNNEFYFEKGCPDLIVRFTVLLTKYTGPLVLICDAGGPPLVVTASANPQALFESWGY